MSSGNDACIGFLQWALPLLHLRWAGFRRVRKQVCKRIQQRIRQLGLADLDAYRSYLHTHEAEWRTLDTMCRITISRFYRDTAVLAHLGTEVLPVLAEHALARGETGLRCWSAGCASGEEAYSLVLLWDRVAGKAYPQLDIHVTATDIDTVLLERARVACYPFSSVKALPAAWLQAAFSQKQGGYCLEQRLRSKVSFLCQDIRQGVPNKGFHLVLCRNMAFTYFDKWLQSTVLATIHASLRAGGVLVLGGHESLPDECSGFNQWLPQQPIYRRTDAVNRPG